MKRTLTIYASVLAIIAGARMVYADGFTPIASVLQSLTIGGVILTGPSAGTLKCGADSTSPASCAFIVPNALAGTANTAGGATTYAGSQSTGNGAPGPIIWQLSGIGTAGATTVNALFSAMTLTSTFNGAATLNFPAGNATVEGAQSYNIGTGSGGSWFATALSLPSNSFYAFSATTNAAGTKDTGVSRTAAGVVTAGNGTQGNATGQFSAASYIAGGSTGVTKTCGATIIVTGGIITSC